jgi:hypothetical protein
MSTKEAVTIASRTLAVYCLFWLLSDLSYMPSRLFSFLHHENILSAPGATAYTAYLRNYDLVTLSFSVLRLAGLFFAVQWFYRSGPTIQEYFLGSSKEASPK